MQRQTKLTHISEEAPYSGQKGDETTKPENPVLREPSSSARSIESGYH